MEIGGSAKGHSLVFFDFTVSEDIVSFWKALPVQPDILINNASVFNRMTLLEESLPEEDLDPPDPPEEPEEPAKPFATLN